MAYSPGQIQFSWKLARVPKWLALIMSVIWITVVVMFGGLVDYIDFLSIPSTPTDSLSTFTGLVSYLFMHGSLGHLGLNISCILCVGAIISTTISQKTIAILSVVAGIQFAVLWMLIGSPSDTRFIGAAPIGYAYIGALLVLLIMYWSSFTIPSRVFSVAIIAITFLPHINIVMLLVGMPNGNSSILLLSCTVPGIVFVVMGLKKLKATPIEGLESQIK